MAAYNQWANQRVFDGLSEQDGTNDMWARFSHIVLAEVVWQCRMKGEPIPSGGIFQQLEKETIKEILAKNEAGWEDTIRSISDFNKKLDYKMLNGTPVQSSLSDILTHIFNHGTYHRGQIATLMRQENREPVSTDFISFSRLG
jgi:uncharacterized damage-inducible protein DinB